MFTNSFLVKFVSSGMDPNLTQLIQTFDALLYCREIGEHTTQPTLVNIVLTAPVGFFEDCVLRLFLSAYKQHSHACGGGVLHKLVCPFEQTYRFLKIDNINAVSGAKEVPTVSSWVPSSGLMTKMNPSFQQLFHGNKRQVENSFSG